MNKNLGESEVKRAARDIATRCRRLVEGRLPGPEVGRADWEFSAIAERVIRKLVFGEEER